MTLDKAQIYIFMYLAAGAVGTFLGVRWLTVLDGVISSYCQWSEPFPLRLLYPL